MMVTERWATISAEGWRMEPPCDHRLLRRDNEVRAVARTATRYNANSVYACLGCRVQCGCCTPEPRKIMNDVRDHARVSCLTGGMVHVRHDESAIEGWRRHTRREWRWPKPGPGRRGQSANANDCRMVFHIRCAGGDIMRPRRGTASRTFLRAP